MFCERSCDWPKYDNTDAKEERLAVPFELNQWSPKLELMRLKAPAALQG